MKFLKYLLSWKIWLNIFIMAGIVYALYFFIFKIWLDSYTNHGESINVPDLSKMTVYDAMKTLDDLGLTYEVDSVRFDPEKPSYAVMEYFPSMGSLVKEGRRIFIKSNPKTYRPVELPNLISKSKRLAFTQLDIAGLIVGDTIYEPDIAKDAVLRVLYNGKEIDAGTVLPFHSKVDLVLGKGLIQSVPTPNFVGLGLEQARGIIKQNYFEVGKITYDGDNDTIRGRIFYQYPLPGDSYDQGLPVDLWISSKPRSELASVIKELDKQFRVSNSENLDDYDNFKIKDNSKIQNETIELPDDMRPTPKPKPNNNTNGTTNVQTEQGTNATNPTTGGNTNDGKTNGTTNGSNNNSVNNKPQSNTNGGNKPSGNPFNKP